MSENLGSSFFLNTLNPPSPKDEKSMAGINTTGGACFLGDLDNDDDSLDLLDTSVLLSESTQGELQPRNSKNSSKNLSIDDKEGSGKDVSDNEDLPVITLRRKGATWAKTDADKPSHDRCDMSGKLSNVISSEKNTEEASYTNVDLAKQSKLELAVGGLGERFQIDESLDEYDIDSDLTQNSIPDNSLNTSISSVSDTSECQEGQRLPQTSITITDDTSTSSLSDASESHERERILSVEDSPSKCTVNITYNKSKAVLSVERDIFKASQKGTKMQFSSSRYRDMDSSIVVSDGETSPDHEKLFNSRKRRHDSSTITPQPHIIPPRSNPVYTDPSGVKKTKSFIAPEIRHSVNEHNTVKGVKGSSKSKTMVHLRDRFHGISDHQKQQHIDFAQSSSRTADKLPLLSSKRYPNHAEKRGISETSTSQHKQAEVYTGKLPRKKHHSQGVGGNKSLYTGFTGKDSSTESGYRTKSQVKKSTVSVNESDVIGGLNTKLTSRSGTVTLCDNEVSSSSLSCEACGIDKSLDQVIQCCSGHLICNACVEKEVKKLMSSDNDSNQASIICPLGTCSSSIPDSQAKRVLPSLVIELLEAKMQKQILESLKKMDDLVTCPFCNFPVVADFELKEFTCPNCKKKSCRFCKQDWFIPTKHTDCNRFTALTAQEKVDNTHLEPPVYWDSMAEHGNKDYIVVKLKEKSEELRHIIKLFSESMPQSKVKSVRRIQNPRLWQKFCLSRKHMIEDFGPDKLNEKQLFHGTNCDAFDSICREGLDWRMCGVNGTAFGQGTYFARRADYSHRYSTNKKKLNFGNKHFFAQAQNLPSPFLVSHTNSTGFTLAGFSGSSSSQQSGGFVPSFGFFAQHHQQNPNAQNQQQIPSNLSNTFTTTSHFINPNRVSTHTTIPGASIKVTQNRVPQTQNLQSLLASNQDPSDISKDEHSTDATEKTVTSKVEEVIKAQHRYLLVARVLVGRMCAGHSKMRKPPADPNDPKHRPFTCCVDNVASPFIFVIFDSAQCYPEYIIEYK